jgi:hypothetical protein
MKGQKINSQAAGIHQADGKEPVIGQERENLYPN